MRDMTHAVVMSSLPSACIRYWSHSFLLNRESNKPTRKDLSANQPKVKRFLQYLASGWLLFARFMSLSATTAPAGSISSRNSLSYFAQSFVGRYLDTRNFKARGLNGKCGPFLDANILKAFALLKTHSIRSEEHTSELQSLMRITYAVFCLKKKSNNNLIPTLNYFPFLNTI